MQLKRGGTMRPQDIQQIFISERVIEKNAAKKNFGASSGFGET